RMPKMLVRKQLQITIGLMPNNLPAYYNNNLKRGERVFANPNARPLLICSRLEQLQKNVGDAHQANMTCYSFFSAHLRLSQTQILFCITEKYLHPPAEAIPGN